MIFYPPTETRQEAAVGTAFTRLAEDHLYWMIVASRWLDDEWFEVVKRDFFSALPSPLRKILPVAASGGQAKLAVASGQVLVNGEVETARRKKIVSGDTIEFDDDKIYIKFSSSIEASQQNLS